MYRYGTVQVIYNMYFYNLYTGKSWLDFEKCLFYVFPIIVITCGVQIHVK